MHCWNQYRLASLDQMFIPTAPAVSDYRYSPTQPLPQPLPHRVLLSAAIAQPPPYTNLPPVTATINNPNTLTLCPS